VAKSFNGGAGIGIVPEATSSPTDVTAPREPITMGQAGRAELGM